MPSAGKYSLNLHSLNFHSVNFSFWSSSRTTERIAHAGSIPLKEKVMKATSKIALAMVGSFALGAAAVQSLHAQATPPGYAIVEVNVTDKDGYTKEFLPVIAKDIQAAGGKYVVRGGNPVALQGAPPASRVAVLQFDSVEKLRAWWSSPGHTSAQAIGDKYATTRAFAVEGATP
jgi:uncharacterized protein (DUF1330 family)